MLKEKTLARVFFALALAVSAGAGVQQAMAAEAIAPDADSAAAANCLDGMKQKCWEGPVGGGTGYKYWV